MSHFIKLEDSPMFRKQLHFLETTTDELKERCQRLLKGCKKYVAAIGDACDADVAFADCLEEFGAGRDDPVSVSIGGPVISRFVTTLRELATYKELLRSQVEHMLTERLMQFLTVDLLGAKESRRHFDKGTHVYDQAREKFMSLKKGARADIVTELEEALHNSKSSFEKCRFNLVWVNALTNIEAKKKFEFLESVSAIMDAHMRFYKQGYGLLGQLEPLIHQVIAVLIGLRRSKCEQRLLHKATGCKYKINMSMQILTYTLQSKEMSNIEQDKLAKRIQEFRTQVELDNLRASSNVVTPTSDHGFHVSRTNSYKNIEALMQSAAKGEGPQSYQSTGTSEYGGGMFGRFKPRHHRASSLGDENLGCRTVDLRTSTIKIDAEHTDLRLCFRIISPSKAYTLQAENEADRLDWVEKIRGVIASLLSSPFLEKDASINKNADGGDCESLLVDGPVSSEDEMKFRGQGSVSRILREISGNDLCAECSASEPEWASLNLGILLCIECSGVHRNLGVHVSKYDLNFSPSTAGEINNIRCQGLGVPILDLFSNLGNSHSNSVWEELLQLQNQRTDKSDANLSITKPGPRDAILTKEKYIQSKYVEKLFVIKAAAYIDAPSHATRIWEAVKSSNLQAVYRIIVTSDVNINTSYEQVDGSDCYHAPDSEDDPTVCQRIKDSGEPANCLQGCSLLHLACHVGNIVMLELLLQFGADINRRDFHGRTPLHHCIAKGNNLLAKYLLRRGARSSLKDGGGLSGLERAMEMGAIADEKLFILLTKSE
ncbi:hypothetical protein IFM89_007769 [Coptis chinensis]|uniref:Uncharacterized protein n=1 Tax=Coptis chinensis TaxID=261450 RepID=A0A835MHM4_9MAGN|nr:hypothetical protein IFM89_007769 [Coptis chinensis]